MILAFYKVSNSKNYERHTFDDFYDDGRKIKKMLSRLKDDEVKYYDLTRNDWSSRTPSMADFVEDYNDEELDGGWWCVIIP